MQPDRVFEPRIISGPAILAKKFQNLALNLTPHNSKPSTKGDWLRPIFNSQIPIYKHLYLYFSVPSIPFCALSVTIFIEFTNFAYSTFSTCSPFAACSEVGFYFFTQLSLFYVWLYNSFCCIIASNHKEWLFLVDNMTKTQKSTKAPSLGSTVARQDDGTIQITYQIPHSLIQKTQEKVISETAKETTIAGFRKGAAPLDKVKESLSSQTLIQKTLSKILPQALAESINKDKIRPAVYPKFELISADEDKDWQVRATTCELPSFNLGEYKQILTGQLRAKSIWTPDKKAEGKDQKELSPAEKQQIVIKTLLENIKVNLPKLIIDEEVDNKLSQLLEKIEKLGLNLDSYLSSLGKTPQALRSEYETQAKEAVSLELILNKIAQEENIVVDEKEIQEAITAATSSDKSLEKNFSSPQQKSMLKAILVRKKTLDYLTNLV
jgi:hypothetical protein